MNSTIQNNTKQFLSGKFARLHEKYVFTKGEILVFLYIFPIYLCSNPTDIILDTYCVTTPSLKIKLMKTSHLLYYI